ncbi:hypothetical protein Verru16b_01803 [Lacunisphaera limnophila]|uniref:SMP-30/Gluconolaconase/LRE-like region n=1 Tax=Lacunisphaera limnophila TaxID=1838286 RepID=A0A1D8AV43_9BACT|nr:hypothetical protein [Lacunisphaera limnophila]AOS44735.1 hypothetical protein Verru16b_01803 [Lacunisphaera limnophila]
MKHLLACLTLVVTASGATAPQPLLLWETDGFVGPESVVFDPARQEFYVSNMGTHGGGQTPGDGFISRVSAEGKILELKWVTGFDNPKGLALTNGRLYVGDDKDLTEIDVAAGKISLRYAPADGPGSFNDCTADAAGNIYVCSGRLDTVFRLSAGKFEPWFKLDKAKTGGLNGLKAEKDRLLLGGWSLRGADGKEQIGHISTVAYADKAFGRIGDQPVCHVDGLEPDGQGGYTVTDWLTGDVLHVTADGKTTPLLALGRGTADHAYLIGEKQLIIPQMLEHKLRAFRWAPAGE